MIEKHGGFWVERNDAYSRCVYEAYEKDVDVLATVHTDSENLFIAQVHKKVPDYQWILPVWGGDQVEALFDNEADAIAHVRKVIANMKHPGHE